jgi:hypothetical protein
MSAPPSNTTIFEGTWDELLQHAPQLAGHRLQVKVLDPALTQPYIPPGVDPQHPGLDNSPEGIDAWVASLRSWADNRPEIRLGDDSRDAVYEDFLK